MAIELKRLLEKVSNYDITLLAGGGGLSNPVSWVHMVENKEASCFLDGGEVVFLTGVGLSAQETLYDLVKEIHLKKAAGVVINIGPFIEDVPDEVVKFCDRNNFPLLLVPWKIHLAEINKIFCSSISREEQRSMQISSAFKNAIKFPKQEEMYTVFLSQHNFQPSWCYNACSIKIYDKAGGDSVSVSRLDVISAGIENYLHHQKHKLFAAFSNDDEVLVIFANHLEDACKKITEDIISYLKIAVSDTEDYAIGVGRSTKSIRCLYKSYNQAHSIQKLNRNGKIDASTVTYSEIGIYRLLIGIEEPEIITEYYNKTLKPLEEYDEKNDCDLCNVLRVYLMHNGSVKETSDILFIHRNTVNYKINKASEILHMDLTSLENRVQLYLGFMLKDML